MNSRTYVKMMAGISVIVILLIISTAGAEITGKIWKPLPLRTQEQADRDMPGGQGMQKIFSISYAPTDPSIAYFVSDTSGVWRGDWDIVGKHPVTNNDEYGFKWISKRGYYDEVSEVHHGFRAFGGFSLVVDPANSNIVFVSGSNHQTVSSCNQYGCPKPVEGIYRTLDGGDSWDLLKNTSYYHDNDDRNSQGQHYVFDPDSKQCIDNCGGPEESKVYRHMIIYAGTHTEGLLKSIDGGETWTTIGLVGNRIFDLELNREHSGWHDNAWEYRQKITIQSGLTNSVLRDFPVLIKISAPSNQVFQRSISEVRSDILFTLSDGKTILDHEIERFSKAEGKMEIWVRIPVLTSSSGTDIYMYYENSSASGLEHSQDVWDSNYLMVHHLNDNHSDSTGNLIDCSPLIDLPGDMNAAGHIANADYLDGDDYVDCGDAALNFNSSFTVEVLINTNDWNDGESNGSKPIVNKYDYDSNGNKGWLLGRPWGPSNGLLFGIYDGTGNVLSNYNNGNVTSRPDEWIHLAGVFKAGEYLKLYMDADELDSRSTSWTSFAPASGYNLMFGKRSESNDFYTGLTDEIRISSIARSAEWINASYKNQISNDTYLDIGPEEHVSSVTDSDTLIIYAATDVGLYEVINDTVSALPIDDLPDHPRTIALEPQNSSSNDIIYAAAGVHRVYKSDDGGETFVSSNSGLPDMQSSGKEYKIIQISKADPDYLYVTIDEYGGWNPYYSHDGGQNWYRPSSSDPKALNVDNLHMASGTYSSPLVAPYPPCLPNEVECSNEARREIAMVTFGGGRVNETLNGGKTYRYTSSGYMGPENTAGKTSTYFSTLNPGHKIRFLLDWGPAFTTDNGLTWELMIADHNVPFDEVNNKRFLYETTVGTVNNLGTLITTDDIIVTSIGDSGGGLSAISRSEDGGSFWTVFDGGSGYDRNGNTHSAPDTRGYFKFMMFHPGDPDVVYAATTTESWISYDSGISWTEIPGKSIRAVFPGNGDIVYALEQCSGTDVPETGCANVKSVLWRSAGFELDVNGKRTGIIWETEPVAINPFKANIYDVDIDPYNSDRIYLTRGDQNSWNEMNQEFDNEWQKGGIWVFDGLQWQETGISGGIPREGNDFGVYYSVHNVAVDPNTPNIVYAGMWVPTKGYRRGFIYRSTDYGVTWENIGLNIGDYSKISSLAVDPFNSVLHARTAHGHYVLCTDNGNFIVSEGGPCGDVDSDADGDGLDNDYETLIGTDPDNSDSDGDGIADYSEVCYDGDCNNYNPHPAGSDLDALSPDTDHDGISDIDDICPFVLPIRIIDTYYSSLYEAYSSAPEDAIIEIHREHLIENPVLDMSKTVTINGGRSCDYSDITGMTTLNGSIEIVSGSMTIESVILQ